MDPATSIVAATAADVPEVRRLADEIWRRHYRGILSSAQIEYMLERDYSSATLMAFLDQGDCGVALAQRGAARVGFVAWRRHDAHAMKLEKLYVLPVHHGTGVGRALIDHVIAQARSSGCTSVRLNVNRGNTGAIRAYERCGFSIRDSGDFPIGGGFVMEDFIMGRDL